MPRYLFVYYGGKSGETPAEMEKLNNIWMKWFADQGKAVIDMGAPTNPVGKLVSSSGIKAVGAKPVTGYSIFDAAGMDAAVAIAKGSPQMAGGGQAAIYELAMM